MRRRSGGERPSRALAQVGGPRPEGRLRVGDFVAGGEKGRGLPPRALRVRSGSRRDWVLTDRFLGWRAGFPREWFLGKLRRP